METKSIVKSRNNWPALFENTSWFDRFFNTSLDEYINFGNFGKVSSIPSINLAEHDHTYELTLATPGLEREDIKIEIGEGMLTISAEKEEKDSSHYNRREYNYCSWSRSFSLPEPCDENKITAEYKNGELKIKIPRTEVEKAPTVKRISIS